MIVKEMREFFEKRVQEGLNENKKVYIGIKTDKKEMKYNLSYIGEVQSSIIFGTFDTFTGGQLKRNEIARELLGECMTVKDILETLENIEDKSECALALKLGGYVTVKEIDLKEDISLFCIQ